MKFKLPDPPEDYGKQDGDYLMAALDQWLLDESEKQGYTILTWLYESPDPNGYNILAIAKPHTYEGEDE